MRAFVLVFLPLLIAYAMTIVWCVERWNSPTQYFAHCWLVPIVAAVVVWRRRADWSQRPIATDARGLWLLLPGVVLHLAGALLMVDSWSAASLLLAGPGAAWFAFGRARLIGLWPVLGLMAFVIPAPIYVEGRLAFTLKEIAVEGGAFIGNLLGAGVVRSGDHLQPTGLSGSLYVAEACSGLRSLLAMLTISYCLAFFTGPKGPWRRISLLLMAAPMAITANVLRIASLCLSARWFGVPFAQGAGHTIANVVEWLALLVALLTFDRWFARRLTGPAELAKVPSPDWTPAASVPRGSPVRVGIVLWLLAGPLLWLCSYRPFGDREGRAELLPVEVHGFALQARTEAEERRFQQTLPQWRELLGTRDFVFRRYRDEAQRLVSVTALFHDTNWKSVHPPRICIEGSDMDILHDDLVPAPWIGEDVIVSRIVAKRRSDDWHYVTLSAFGTHSWTSGDYWQFTWHHLPLAVLRQNDSGFLLRVESPIYSGESLSQPEARCALFLERLLPLCRELLQ